MSTTIKELLAQVVQQLEQLNRREEAWIQEMRLHCEDDLARIARQDEETRQRWQAQSERDERFRVIHQQERQEDLERIARERKENLRIREKEIEKSQRFALRQNTMLATILSQAALQQAEERERS